MVVFSVFLIIDMSCYNVGYIKAIGVSMIIGIHLENVYNIIHYYVVEYLYRKKKQINDFIEREHLEINDDFKDNPNKTK